MSKAYQFFTGDISSPDHDFEEAFIENAIPDRHSDFSNWAADKGIEKHDDIRLSQINKLRAKCGEFFTERKKGCHSS